jgi:hypothetical protein
MTYVVNRQKYNRPQAILFSENDGTADGSGKVYPDGFEIGANTASATTFLILSDHNRAPIDISYQRLEKRERMINGRMRSFHIADKMNLSLSWTMLPSRRYAGDPDFEIAEGLTQGVPTNPAFANYLNDPNGYMEFQYTVDGGAGGADILEWYEDHTGPFFVYLSYDKPQNFTTNKYEHLQEYTEIVEMYISDISYTINKRAHINRKNIAESEDGTGFDYWDISLTLEEV